MAHCATPTGSPRRFGAKRLTRTRTQMLRSQAGKHGISTVAVLPTFDMLLFGGTGDLVTRKLLPALYRRYAAGQVSAQSRIFGVARSALSRTEYLFQAETACRDFLGKEFDTGRWQE